MFGLDMMWNYEQRKVGNYSIGDLCLDTARVTDGEHEYQTAVAHPEYNDGEWIVVEAYDSLQKAQEGHDKWVKIMTTNPPDVLIDCQNSCLSQLLSKEDLTFKRTVKEK